MRIRPRRLRVRHRRLAGVFVLLAALLTVGTAYSVATARTGSAASGDPGAQIAQGRALFLQGCASCHGKAGEGTAAAPSLIGVGAAAVDFQVSTGRMPLAQAGAQAPAKRPRYTQEQIDALAAYVASLGPGPAIPGKEQYTPPKNADLAFGGTLFRTNCSACHNFTGEGGALAYGKKAPPLTHATDKQLYEAMLTGPGTMPVFSDQQLTPQEKQDIIAYITTVRSVPDPGGFNLGRLGPVTEGLVGWLIGMGVLAVVAMWIGARAKRAQ
ncbi:MAG: c-type cytochrome [Acidothermus cellulolyticus]|nr:c-type cytochrome [Acidothermus cellulolyticus]